MLIYILKSSACLTVFILFYKFYLEKESFHNLKRFYLIGTIFISIIIPFITFTQYVEIPTQIIHQTNGETDFFIENSKIFQKERINYLPIILWSIYGLGVTVFSFRFIHNLSEIIYKIKTNVRCKYHEFTNVLVKNLIIPHTFFNYMFFNKKQYEAHLIPEEIFWHEQTHAKQKHSLDILFIELLQIVFWFNPLLYFIKKNIKLNHEFLADQAVINKGVQLSIYQNLLLEFSSHSNSNQLTNAINYSSIKKRFKVMKTQSTKYTVWFRSLVLLPLLVLLVYSFSERKIIEKFNKNNTFQEIKKQKDSVTGATSDMMQEYNTFIQEVDKTHCIHGNKLYRAIAIYDIMTPKQRATVKMYPKFPSSNLSKVQPKQPSNTEFNSWKNKSKFALWLDGNHVNNTVLEKYNPSDIIYYSSSFVYNNARSKKFPQSYQNSLYTKKGFEETYLKSGVKKYNHLKYEYLNAKKDNSLSISELRILKAQIDRVYNNLSKKEIKKYNVKKTQQKNVSRNEVIEYNKLWNDSSPEFHYTKQTYWIKDKNGKKIAKKYYELSEFNKRKWLLFPPKVYQKKQISLDEFNRIKDESKYVVWINGVVANKSKLNTYKNSDFVTFSKSLISDLAKMKQKYHYNLHTKDGLKMIGFLGVRSYKRMYKRYTKNIKSYINGKTNNYIELTKLHHQIRNAYQSFTPEIIKENNLKSPPLAPQTANLLDSTKFHKN